MDGLKKLEEIEQISDHEEVPGLTYDDTYKTRPIELRCRSTRSHVYWHADTIPLGNIGDRL